MPYSFLTELKLNSTPNTENSPDETSVAIIIPCLNEEKEIGKTLQQVLNLRPKPCELIIIDGGSCDQSVAKAKQLMQSETDIAVKIIETQQADRGSQLNEATEASKSNLICYLHADTSPPPQLLTHVRKVLSQSKVAICAFHSCYRVNQRIEPFITSLNFLKTYLIPLIFFPRLYFSQGFRLFFGDQLICCLLYTSPSPRD